MSKEVTKTETTDVVVSEEMAAWGADQDISSQDVMISKILPMQGSSKLIGEGKAMFGEYRDSVTEELLGSIKEPVEFIPFHCEKFWIVNKKESNENRFKYAYREPITRENENRSWTEKIGDVEYKYEYTFMFYVIFPKDVEDGIPTPRTIQFKSTSVRGGKKLFTQMFVRNKQMKLTPASFVMSLLGKKMSNSDNTWISLDVETSRKSTQPEMMAAFELFNAVKGGEQKVDHSDIEKTSQGKGYEAKDLDF